MFISEAHLEATRDKVDKINTRAAKKGLTGYLAIEATPAERKHYNPMSGKEVTLKGYDVTITGEAPKVNGWSFLARIEWTPQGDPVLFNAPDVQDGEIDRRPLVPGGCDHCGYDRQRNETYIVKHDDGRQLQVGSTCLKDFLGWNARPVWFTIDPDEILEGSRVHDDPQYEVTDVVAIAWACIKVNGWAPASFDYPTKAQVADVLDPAPRDEAVKELQRKVHPLVADAEAIATNIVDYIRSDAFGPAHNEYVANMKSIFRPGSDGKAYTTRKMFGFAVSAPQAFMRGQERTLVQKTEKAAVNNEYVGQVGDKLSDVEVTITSYRPTEGFYGVTHLYKMRDEAGHQFTWFANRDALGEETGVKVTLKRATVKEHKVWNGINETVLTRCSVAA